MGECVYGLSRSPQLLIELRLSLLAAAIVQRHIAVLARGRLFVIRVSPTSTRLSSVVERAVARAHYEGAQQHSVSAAAAYTAAEPSG